MNTRLYSSTDQFLRWIDDEERQRLEALNAVEDRMEQRGEKKKFTGVKLKGFEPSLFYSNCSLSFSDMKQNVEGVKRVVAKIEVWPEVSDTKAVVVVAGRRVTELSGYKEAEEALRVCSWPR